MSLIPFDLAILHKILNDLRKRPPNQILDHTYLFLTSKTFHSPTLRSFLERLPLSFPGSAFLASRPGGFWERSQVFPRLYSGMPWITRRLQFPEFTGPGLQATSCDRLLPFSRTSRLLTPVAALAPSRFGLQVFKKKKKKVKRNKTKNGLELDTQVNISY